MNPGSLAESGGADGVSMRIGRPASWSAELPALRERGIRPGGSLQYASMSVPFFVPRMRNQQTDGSDVNPGSTPATDADSDMPEPVEPVPPCADPGPDSAGFRSNSLDQPYEHAELDEFRGRKCTEPDQPKAAGLSPRAYPNRLAAQAPRLLLAIAMCFAATIAQSTELDDLIRRLDRLEEENRQLRQEVELLKAGQRQAQPHAPAPDTEAAPRSEPEPVLDRVEFDPEFGFAILDPTTNINRKQRLILDRKTDGTLRPDRLHLHGAITAIANYQSSNREGKFGYLMRHPTSDNQVGRTVSEATIHSAQLGFTGTVGPWVTGHAELLFDPEQSFGTGTNTDLERNQVQVRRAYVQLGDLRQTPFHGSLGKMSVPFGLTDTVNPFTASTIWHAFGGLANGISVGYAGKNANMNFMSIQGGAQFRAANTPVDGTSVPSKLNNFVVDTNYSFDAGPGRSLLLGASYQRGSAYCQDYPIKHFEPCRENNPAFGFYGRYEHGNLTLKGEFARTKDEWPGSFNPSMPQFPASKVTSFDMGVKYRLEAAEKPLDLSAEFSRFQAGPDGAPWERQDQLVLGAAWFPRPNAKFFLEFVNIRGYAPLNFMSGGSEKNDSGETMHDRTHSDRSARSNVFLIGTTAAF